jgi:hypothetical protein
VEFRLPAATEAYRSELARWTDRRSIRPGFDADEWRDFARRDLLVRQAEETPVDTAVALMEVARKGLPGPLLDARLIADASTTARDAVAAGQVVCVAWGADLSGRSGSAVGWGAVADITLDPAGAELARGPLPAMTTAYLHPHGWWDSAADPAGSSPVVDRWLYSGALLSGLATGALELATRYVGERVQFGRPIGSFQAVQFPLAQAKALTEGLRLMVLDAAWRLAAGRTDADIAAALLCVCAEQVSRAVTETTHQAYGATGLANESGLNELTWGARWLRHEMRLPAARSLIASRRANGQTPPPSLVLQGFAATGPRG